MKILYAEDDPFVAKSVMQIIKIACPDADVVPAKNFAECAVAAEKGGIDLVVSDYKFPGCNPSLETGGLDLYGLLGDKVPFYFLSGTDAKTITSELRERKLNIPSGHIVTKPCNLTQILGIFADYQREYAPKPRADSKAAPLPPKPSHDPQ